MFLDQGVLSLTYRPFDRLDGINSKSMWLLEYWILSIKFQYSWTKIIKLSFAFFVGYALFQVCKTDPTYVSCIVLSFLFCHWNFNSLKKEKKSYKTFSTTGWRVILRPPNRGKEVVTWRVKIKRSTLFLKFL